MSYDNEEHAMQRGGGHPDHTADFIKLLAAVNDTLAIKGTVRELIATLQRVERKIDKVIETTLRRDMTGKEEVEAVAAVDDLNATLDKKSD